MSQVQGTGRGADSSRLATIMAVPAVSKGRLREPGFGIKATLGRLELVQDRPVHVVLSGHGLPGRDHPYSRVQADSDSLVGEAEVAVGDGAFLRVRDAWTARGAVLSVAREVTVVGEGAGGFMTSLALARQGCTGWPGVVPFAPGAVYGNSLPVPALSIASPQQRQNGMSCALVREDRLAAPMFALLYEDGHWLSVMHRGAQATTTVADRGRVNGGETLVDSRFGYASVGAREHHGRLHLGAFFPGTEGPTTYSTGCAPLKQYRHWRHRYHPLADGQAQAYHLTFSAGQAVETPRFFEQTWRTAWRTWAPQAEAVPPAQVVEQCAMVLASQVATGDKVTGLPLEVDSVTGRPRPGSPAIMGFVGANTDAGYVLVRMRDVLSNGEGDRVSRLGAAVLDSFTRLELAPPRGEGFDLRSGRPRTYRRLGRLPVVYTRSIADGCSGALKAWEYEERRGRHHDHWLAWASSGAEWLTGQQAADGSFPRAWQAGSGRVAEPSTNATHIPAAFLARLGGATGNERFVAAALGAAEFSWSHGGREGSFAGATLDNPDVVDKEAAVYALEAYLALHTATGDGSWLERACLAASVAETWVYIWDIPMPTDGDASDLHWERGIPTVGQQLIASGVSTCDGFLAMNAAAFAELYRLTGDDHFLAVARLVTHGTKAMLSLPGRERGAGGPGWQQEHWSFAIPRGVGLTRDWLPWVAVANIEGLLRLMDMPEDVGRLVLGPTGT